MFIGREVEMERLRRMYDSPNQEVVLIYGRRRIGKSELIKQFLKTSKIQGLYYQCKRTTEMNNVQSLSALISEVYQYPPLAFTGMEKLLDFLFSRPAVQGRFWFWMNTPICVRQCPVWTAFYSL